MTACNRPSGPRRLAARSAGIACLTVSLAACNSPAQPGPLPDPTVTVAETLVISGRVVVYDSNGAAPRGGVPLRIRKADGGTIQVSTDSDGRYEAAGAPRGLTQIDPAPGSEYRTLCQRAPVPVPGPSFLYDLALLHASWTSKRPPPGMPVYGSAVMGTVAERVNGALVPVPSANVEHMLDPAGQFVFARDTTDTTGFYIFCGAGVDVTEYLRVSKAGYVSRTVAFSAGWEYEVNLQLTRE